MVLGQLFCNLHYKQRFLSGMALFEWVVSHIFGLFIPKEKPEGSPPSINKPTIRLTSHEKDFVITRSCVGKNALITG